MTTPEDVPMFPVDLDAVRFGISKTGAELVVARRRVVLTSDTLRTRVVAGVRAGLSENEAAKLAGVTRQTVRSWLGK